MPSDREILFYHFSNVQAHAFLSLGISEEHPVQDVILREGEMGNDMLLIEEGIASVWSQDVKINEVKADSVLGVSALIEPHTRTASLVAETDVCVRRFGRSEVLAYLETIPSKLSHQFFVNAFHVHLRLVRRCEERVVQLAHGLHGVRG